MPIKRTASAPRTPRRPSGKAASRARSSGSISTVAPAALRGRLTSDHEKRELILAHSAMRRAKGDPVQLMSVWAGVAASALVVIIAWAWVFVPSVKSALRSPLDSETQEFIAEVDSAGDHGDEYDLDQSDLGKQIRQATLDVDELSRKAVIQAQALQVMADAIEGTTSTNSRVDLFVPSSAATSTE